MNKLFDLDNWREIGATLSRNKTRTFLTGFGIFWGTAMLTLLLGGADGLRGIVTQQFAGFATNAVFVYAQPTSQSYKGYNKGMSWTMNDRDIALMRATVPLIDASSGLLNGSGSAEYKNKSKMASWSGVESDYFKIMSVNLLDGRLLNASDDRTSAKVALIGKDLAAEFFGADSPLGKYVKVNGVSFNIVGVISQKSEMSLGGRIDEGLVMPFTTMRRAFNLGDRVWFFIFTIKPGHRLAEVRGDIVRALVSGHPISPTDENAVAFNDMAENFERVEGVFLAIAILAGFVGAGTLIAGIVGVGNIMWIIVKERTQEIGIRRAIGARPSDIIFQILSEGTVLTAVAGLAGITFAAIILAIADKLTANPMLGPAGFGLPFNRAIAIMVIFLVLGTLAGLIPAVKAMRIKPIEAINDK